MTKFYDSSGSGNAGRGSGAIRSSDNIDVRFLAANTAELHVIPASMTYVIFSSTGSFWAKFGNSGVVAAIPSDDITNGSAPDLNPSVRRIDGITHISLIAPVNTTVVMSFYEA